MDKHLINIKPLGFQISDDKIYLRSIQGPCKTQNMKPGIKKRVAIL